MIKPHVLETLQLGAVYHGIKYQTYLQWLVEEGLRGEARYYGWATLTKRYITHGLNELQKQKIQRVMRDAKRKVRQRRADESTPSEGSS